MATARRDPNWIPSLLTKDPNNTDNPVVVTGEDLSLSSPIHVLPVNADGSGSFGSLVTEDYDYIELTYVAAGDGAGEIETVTYKDGGSGGTTVATLTLGYDTSDRLATVTKT